MEEFLRLIVQWLRVSVKDSPYAWCAVGLTFLVGIQAALAAAVLHGDEATVRRQLRCLQQVGVSVSGSGSDSNIRNQNDSKSEIYKDTSPNNRPFDQTAYVSPVKSCAPIKLNQALSTDKYPIYDNCYVIAAESTQIDDRGYTTWKALTQQTKPLMSNIKTELWIPKHSADENDPLVKARGCIVVSFLDPAVPGWLRQLAGYSWKWLAIPQVTCILPLHPTAAEIEEHQIKLRPFTIDTEEAQGLDMETFPPVSDILLKLKVFLGFPDRQGLTIFKKA